MSDEEQERLADELDQHVERLRLQKAARPPDNLTPDQKAIYGMAALFHVASSSVEDPRPEFSAQLYQRLCTQIQDADEEQMPLVVDAETAELQEKRRPINSWNAHRSGQRTEAAGIGEEPVPVTSPLPPQQQLRRIYRNGPIDQPVPISASTPDETDAQKRKKRGLSRRTLLTSGTIAASLVGGVAIGGTVEHALKPAPTSVDLHPHIKGTEWYPVASADQLGTEPIFFKAKAITGYVIRQAADSAGPVIAFSAACTHLGCTVQWKASTRQFPCPCHGRIFDTMGNPVYEEKSEVQYIALPRLETKVENGNIYVKVPIL